MVIHNMNDLFHIEFVGMILFNEYFMELKVLGSIDGKSVVITVTWTGQWDDADIAGFILMHIGGNMFKLSGGGSIKVSLLKQLL